MTVAFIFYQFTYHWSSSDQPDDTVYCVRHFLRQSMTQKKRWGLLCGVCCDGWWLLPNIWIRDNSHAKIFKETVRTPSGVITNNDPGSRNSFTLYISWGVTSFIYLRDGQNWYLVKYIYINFSSTYNFLTQKARQPN